MGRLSGKIALVTGAARGMGAATAALFAREGARVIVADLAEREGLETAASIGDNATFVQLDVTDETSWHEAVGTARTRFGNLDILVNNAGILIVGTVLDSSLDDFTQTLNVNVVGTFLGIRAVSPGMIEHGGGSIVNVSSIDGLRGSNGYPAYVASKWGVRGLTKAAALELGHRGVRVNSIHPGGINTHMANPTNLAAGELPGYDRVPLQRIGEPEEVAYASLFLASDEASYICGAEISVDGGWGAGVLHPMLPGGPHV